MRIVIVALLLLATGCQRSASGPGPSPLHDDSANKTVAGNVLSGVIGNSEINAWVYRDVSDTETEADAILVVVLNIRGRGSDEHEFSIKRMPKTEDSDPTCINTGWAADGVSKDGNGIGEIGSIDVLEGDATHITVHVSVAGTGEDQKRFKVEEELSVPWLGQAEKKLPNGGSISVTFARPKDKAPFVTGNRQPRGS